MKKLVLIDGANFFYRGCWSNNQTLLSMSGEDTTYTYAFFRNLFSLVRQLETRDDDVDFVACWDGGYTERLRISSEAVRAGIIPKTYKQERRDAREFEDEEDKARKQEFHLQMDKSREVLRHTRVGNAFMLGEEADDLIGSYVYAQIDNYDEIILVTSDKDYYQLLLPRVRIFNPMKSMFVDYRHLKSEFGLDNCHQWLDAGALAGETGASSDTIYGVPRVGIFTACKLVAQYKSLENLLKEAKSGLADDLSQFAGDAKKLFAAVNDKKYKLKGKLTKELRVLAHEDLLEIAYQLKKIRTHLKLTMPETTPDAYKLKEEFDRMNFITHKDTTGTLTIKNY